METKEEYEVKKTFIGGHQKLLYELEEQLHKKFRECVKEWMKIVGVDKKLYWKVGVTTALYDLLNGFDHKASIQATKTFLKAQGYKSEKVGDCEDPFEQRKILPHY